MHIHVIIFNGVYYCVVFNVLATGPQVITKHSANGAADLNAWLAQNGFPLQGLLLQRQHGANLPQGYYFKPYATDHYFRVFEDNQLQEVVEDHQFGDPIAVVADEGF